MNDIVNYIIWVIILSGAMYVFYAIFLHKLTYFMYNRFFLIISFILPLLIPLSNFTFSSKVTENISVIELEEIVVGVGNQITTQNSFSILNIIYIIISSFLVSRMLLGIISIIRLYKNSKKLEKNGLKINLCDKEINPFSFMKQIFINKNNNLNQENLDSIITHESVHIKQRHTYDTLLSELLCSVFWINPFYWILKKELRITHEYLADNEVRKQNIDFAEYFSLLFNNLSGQNINLANNFNKSLTFKRMKMMKKNRSHKLQRLVYLLIIPFTGSLMFITACNNTEGTNKVSTEINTEKVVETTQTEKTYEYSDVDVMPSFPGGDSELMNYLIENIKYPEEAKNDGIAGKVYIGFDISDKGDIKNVQAKRAVHKLLDKEAIRVIKAMPTWTPGEIDGKKVTTSYVIPINFKLADEETEK